ncbi:hypothetical protein MJH12_16140 [bacterium]|nr:hypothetical protein [bacterium]
MALNYETIFQECILGEKEPPKGIFKKDYLLEFLLLYKQEFLTAIQSKIKIWIPNQKIYGKVLLFFYQEDFVLFQRFFLETWDESSFKNLDLLIEILEDLARKDSKNLITFLSLIYQKKIEFNLEEQQIFLQQFYLNSFFDLPLGEKQYYLKLLNTTLPKSFLDQYESYLKLQAEYDHLALEDKHAFLRELLRALISQNQKLIDVSYLNFLLCYHDFSTGMSRSFSKLEKTHQNMFKVIDHALQKGSLKIDWHYMSKLPESSEIHLLMSFLKDRARRTFFRDFLLALIFTMILTYIFEAQRMALWIIVCLVANLCEYYFAHHKLNKIYYIYRLKMPCLSFIGALHPLLLYQEFSELDIKDSYELQLLDRLKKDPWLYFPARFKIK